MDTPLRLMSAFECAEYEHWLGGELDALFGWLYIPFLIETHNVWNLILQTSKYKWQKKCTWNPKQYRRESNKSVKGPFSENLGLKVNHEFSKQQQLQP